jgi:hypothetical protein
MLYRVKDNTHDQIWHIEDALTGENKADRYNHLFLTKWASLKDWNGKTSFMLKYLRNVTVNKNENSNSDSLIA